MKTIEQASYEALNQSPSYVVKHDSVFHEGFARGVEFAQRWIPVEVEQEIKSLPEYNEILYHARTLTDEQFREYWNDVQGNVL